MNRRNFLMKLGAGFIGCLVVRPSFTEPNYYNHIFYDNAGGGKSLIVNKSMRDTYLQLLGIPYHQDNASVGTWLGITRSQETFFKSSR